MFCQQFLDYCQKIVDKTSNVERIQAVPNDTALLPVLIKYYLLIRETKSAYLITY